ncbi:MAG: TIGR00730 family Rossman fold protein [Acidimicrobiales bacterium]
MSPRGRPPRGGAEDGVGPEVSALVERVLDTAGVRHDRDVVRGIVLATLELIGGDASRLDLKLARAALGEMAEAFQMFAPYRDVRKVTLFGSARTEPSDRTYELARALAARFAAAGWMVVTGAGPGIMAAGNEGAGPEMTFGVNISLPGEAEPNQWIAENSKLVEMKYFFTRKLMLIKESSGFLVLPGGFGTLDECFELLTLLQTGKAEPAPIVLVDGPGERYWRGWEDFVTADVYERGYADPVEAALYRITDDLDAAVAEVLGFHRNYHSRRFVNEAMVIRLRYAPSDLELASLSATFADICSAKGIWRTGPLPAERAGNDHLELARIALEFNRVHHGRLRQLIDALNALSPAGTPTSSRS